MMGCPAARLRVCGLALAFYAASGCGGKLIRLGDGASGMASVAATPGGSGGRDGGTSSAAAAGVGMPASGGSVAGGGGRIALGGGSGTAGTPLVGGSGGVAAGPDEPGGAGADCQHEPLQPNQVLWVGDSWVLRPGGQRSGVAERAQAAGLLAAGEDYANRSAAGASMAAIAKQYEDYETGTTPVKVLLMDGGTWDPLFASITGASVDDAITSSLAEFQRFLEQVAADGSVEDIVYFLVPPLTGTPGVDQMRGPLQSACGSSLVRCHFIDLKDTWTGHSDYMDASGVNPTTAGADAIADRIWTTMQNECVAQ